MQIFIGVFGLEALEEYKTENGSSSIAGKISSAKAFAQEYSNAFYSLDVSPFIQFVNEYLLMGIFSE